jgi:hypothetical protein
MRRVRIERVGQHPGTGACPPYAQSTQHAKGANRQWKPGSNGRSVGVQLKEGHAMLKSAIRRWRDWRRERRIERQERNIARRTLRDYQKPTGLEGGGPKG